jgi:hypothetical protein
MQVVRLAGAAPSSTAARARPHHTSTHSGSGPGGSQCRLRTASAMAEKTAHTGRPGLSSNSVTTTTGI